ncbi:hypothetical protein [Halorubrum sp. AJ67]|uniref:hypothetical protein n=1 Tax=Halorubrum sp. AJ67 TaxID=1173487 RepID=UPI0003DCE67A|nr:hypothetical protein [Halorubrum sp. AJ67]CDK38079.1 hypothetical protein BN903_279 [Halorubrum sp. AJ67]
MQEDVKQRILANRSAVVDIYLSGGNGRLYWPCRLQPVDESIPTVRRSSSKYIIDSGFQEAESNTDTPVNATLGDFTGEATATAEPSREPSLSGAKINELVDAAYERRPDYIIPNDTVNTPNVKMRTAIEETAEKVAAFLDYVDETTFPATVIVPLQPNHALHFAYLAEHYPRQAKRGHFALGGMKNLTPTEQVACIKSFREVAGYAPYVHAFGVGSSRVLIQALRDDPALLQSVDFSTPQHHASSGRIAGTSRIPIYVGTAQGTDSASTSAQLMSAELMDIARMLSPAMTSDEDVRVRWDQFEKYHKRLENNILDANPDFEWELLESRYNSLDELLASSNANDIDTDLLVNFRDKLTNHLDQVTFGGGANTTLGSA